MNVIRIIQSRIPMTQANDGWRIQHNLRLQDDGEHIHVVETTPSGAENKVASISRYADDSACHRFAAELIEFLPTIG